MADDNFSTTLAYTKSRKTSKRTTFQDELRAAISARAQKTTNEKYFDDEDDIVKELLKSEQKSRTFKSEKKKFRINDFILSDEDEENVKPKRVSFLKTKKQASPTPGVCETSTADTDEVSDAGQPSSSRSSDPEIRECLNSETGQWEPASPQPCDAGEESPHRGTVGDEDSAPLSTDQSITQPFFTGSWLEEDIPTPRPRRRTLHVSSNAAEESEVGSDIWQTGPPASSSPGRQRASRSSSPFVSQDVPSDSVSSLSGALSTQEVITNGKSLTRQHDKDISISPMLSRRSPSRGETINSSLYKSSDASFSRERIDLEDKAEENVQNVSISLEEYQEDTADGAPFSASGQSQGTESASKTRQLSSHSAGLRKSKIVRPHTAESKYLGTLKVLDHGTSVKDSGADDADSLRATVYQQWLKHKNEKMKETLQMKRREEKLLVEKKNEETLAKKGEAKASFEAWKEKKVEHLKEKVKQDHEMIRKQQVEMDEKVDKRETAQKVFEKWKTERDRRLKERHRKEKEAEKELKQRQQGDKEDRKRESVSAFTTWSEAKGKRIREKVKIEHRQRKIKEEEDKYEKDEKKQMALEMYEKWLRRKERQQRRERQQRKIQAILQEPPPPWSPPNRTVPFGK